MGGSIYVILVAAFLDIFITEALQIHPPTMPKSRYYTLDSNIGAPICYKIPYKWKQDKLQGKYICYFCKNILWPFVNNFNEYSNIDL